MGAVVLLLLLGVGGFFLGSKLLKGGDNREVVVAEPAASSPAVADQPLTAQATPEPAAPAVSEQVTPAAPVKETPQATPAPAKTEKPAAQTAQSTATKEDVSADNTVRDVVEQMPSFPGGTEAMMSYVSRSIKYPTVAEENGIQGLVTVSFVVEKDGSISGAKVIRSVDPSLDKEALRIIRSMPRWTPGKQDGKPVRVKYTIPVRFKL